MPTERPPLVGEVSANIVDRRCRMIRLTDPHGRILGFIDRNRYFFFQVDPHLYSRGWVDPVPDSLLLRKSGRAGNWTRTPGSVAKDSNHKTTEAVENFVQTVQKSSGEDASQN
jgi:hypothetical protein